MTTASVARRADQATEADQDQYRMAGVVERHDTILNTAAALCGESPFVVRRTSPEYRIPTEPAHRWPGGVTPARPAPAGLALSFEETERLALPAGAGGLPRRPEQAPPLRRGGHAPAGDPFAALPAACGGGCLTATPPPARPSWPSTPCPQGPSVPDDWRYCKCS
jgi:hypothetical protein